VSTRPPLVGAPLGGDGLAPRVATLGEVMALIRADGVGTFAQLSSATIGIGGAEANVAIGLSRLSVRSSWLGRVGRDSFGVRIARELRAEGVDTHALVDEDAPTGLMLKETPAPGRTRVTFHRRASAGSRLSAADVAELDIPSAALLHLTGILPALSASASSATGEAARTAEEHGVPISFDVNHRESLIPAADAAPGYRRLAAAATVVFGGVDELELLVGRHDDDRRLALAISGLGPPEVVVKRGDRGAAVLTPEGDWIESPAIPVTVVDSVGAGDAFVAGYLAERVLGESPRSALATAVRAGAAACGSPGDWEGAPFRADLRADWSDPVSR
jgi:2-dehydro-3-deoxygluconokinase